VDENCVGRRWSVVISRNGRAVYTGVRRTIAPSGAVAVRRTVAARGRIEVSAREFATGEVWRASTTI
jgi:hypothetical protein